MTYKTLDKANRLSLRIKLAETRIEHFTKIKNSESYAKTDNFNIHYCVDGVNYAIRGTEDDIFDIITVLIRYEAGVRDKCKKEFEEL